MRAEVLHSWGEIEVQKHPSDVKDEGLDHMRAQTGITHPPRQPLYFHRNAHSVCMLKKTCFAHLHFCYAPNVASSINLSGSEISVLKALGLTGATTNGEVLQSRVGDFEEAELLDTLQGLTDIGYVISTRDSFRSVKEMQACNFRVNPAYMKMLQEVLDPRKRPEKKSRRRRRE